MKYLILFLFAGLVTILIIDVSARPTGHHSNKRPESSSSSSKKAVAGGRRQRARIEYEPYTDAIKMALDPFGPSITNPELIGRILYNLKKRSLKIADAKRFAERLSLIVSTTAYGLHFKVFEIIVKNFEKYEECYKENRQGALEDLIQTDILEFLFTFARNLGTATSDELAPLMKQLFESSDNHAKDIAERIGDALMSNTDIQKELINSIDGTYRPRTFGTPFTITSKAFRQESKT